MPNVKVGVEVHLECFVDVDNGIVEKAIDGARIERLVELGWLFHQAEDGIGIGLAFIIAQSAPARR